MLLYLDLKHVIAMHDALIERHGGTKGLRDEGLLDSAIAQPAQSVFGEELFPDIPSKCAAYAYFISENQPFLDGNKRTAIASALTFLRLNGYDLKLSLEKSNQTLYELVMQLANKQISRDDLAEWFRKNSRKKKR